jgi:hypothetical protein
MPHVNLLGGEHLEHMRARLFKGSSEVSEARLLFRGTGFCTRLAEEPSARRGSDVDGLLPLLSWHFLLLFLPSLSIWDSSSTLLCIVSLRVASFAPGCWAFLAGEASVELVICPAPSFCTIPLFEPFRALTVASFTLGSWAFLSLEASVQQTI